MAGLKGVLPKGWVTCPLSEIVTVNPGTFSRNPDAEELVSFVPMAAVGAETGRLDPRQTRTWRSVRSGYSRFQDGDILFAKITPCMENGKVAAVSGLVGGRGAGSTEFHVLRPADGVNPKLISYFLLRGDLRRDARARMKGAAGQLRVPPGFFAEMQFPLAPTAEQDRIVAVLEEQLTRLDAAAEALRRVRANLNRYQASILRRAFEGRLVPVEAELARAEGRSYEPAQELLDRLLQLRRLKWEAKQLEGKSTAGRTPPDDRWKARYLTAKTIDRASLPAVPAGWAWASLAEIAELQGGITKGQKRQTGERLRKVPYLRVANVQRGFLDLGEVKQIEATEEEIAQLRLLPGDVLFNEGGDRDKLGRGWIWRGEITECIHQNHVFRARPFVEEIQPKFLSWYGNSLGQRYFLDEGKQTTNLASINLTKLGALPVPLPPVDEQLRIVGEIERQFSLVDSVMRAVELGLKRAGQLRQAVLRYAFEGGLTRQDPNDEPASVLVERLQAPDAVAAAAKQLKRFPKRMPTAAPRRVS